MKGKDLSNLDWQPSTEDMVAYKAIGAKGKEYYLMRNDHNPLLFVLTDGFTRIAGWYTDIAGAIRRVS